ncbi:TVP38/TMEM64 family protein [Arthrobacter sp. VKM Ac-2550]|uniref:TVP38/TMEM64 family protein n=1 Tax=Crystallibacter permensis TaxID=1938888 RepID=UPI0022278065|nr:VTT domain-containing protein [Arthrobacter sp. VKM Ac-2550]MCW2135400.1 putative membrane protein YdjX, TVP38/TMEM64 family, SNARE-associated domain [Arthrobacter sp. VKM Ac-2550]
MRHYLTIVIVLLVVFLALFALVEAAGVPLLVDPSDYLAGAGPMVAAVLGVGLLIACVVLPVPSSVVMIAHGALFGVVLGAVLSLVGSISAAMVGFAIGRGGGPLLERLVPASERQRADALLERWGMLAVVVTRPVPMLAETTAILAGASRAMSWPRVGLAAALGSVPAAVLYAVAGSIAVGIGSVPLVFALVLGVAALTWLVERVRSRQRAKAPAVIQADPASGEASG